MPELPEVETIKRDLQPRVIGRTITGVHLYWSGAVAKPSADELVGQTAGRRIEAISRRGKYLILGLSGGKHLIVHLRMTGRFMHRSAGDPEDTYTRAVFELEDGSQLRFADLRKFGRLWLVDDPEEVVGKLGPEPLGEEFTIDYLAGALAKRSLPVKALLLDQTIIAGIGNIYADEALFLARIHAKRVARSLSGEEIARLHQAIRAVLALGIANRGTTLSDYRDAFGLKGRQQEALKVFRRVGKSCPVCGTPIERIVAAGRGTFFCPRCQTAPQ